MRQRKTPPEQAPGAFLYGVPTGNDTSHNISPERLNQCKYLRKQLNFVICNQQVTAYTQIRSIRQLHSYELVFLARRVSIQFRSNFIAESMQTGS